MLGLEAFQALAAGLLKGAGPGSGISAGSRARSAKAGVALCCLLASPSWAAPKGGRLEGGLPIQVYVIPFDVDTYTPVTRADIECRAMEEWTLSGRQMRRLKGMIERSRGGPFNEKKVRVKVAVAGDPVFLDADGNVRSEAGDGTMKLKAFQAFAAALPKGARSRTPRKECRKASTPRE